MKFRLLLVIGILFFLSVNELLADDTSESAKELVSKVAKNLSSARSLYFECDVKTETYSTSSTQHRIVKLKDKNKIVFKQIQKISDTQEEYLNIGDGSRIFFYHNIAKQFIEQGFTTNLDLYKERFNSLFEAYLILAFYLGSSPKDVLFQIYEKAVWKITSQNGNNLKVVSAEDSLTDEDLKKVYSYLFKFYIDEKNLLIRKYELSIKEADTLLHTASEEYTNIKLNENIDDKDFVFTIPDGVKKVDGFENIGIARLNLFLGKKLADYPAVNVDDDKDLKLSDYEGKVLVIDLWDSREQYLQREISDFIELYQKYNKEGLEIIGISVEEKGVVQKFAQTNKVNYKLFVYKRNSNLPHPYSLIETIPTIFVLDKKGRLRKFFTGNIEKDDFESEIKNLLNEQ